MSSYSTPATTTLNSIDEKLQLLAPTQLEAVKAEAKWKVVVRHKMRHKQDKKKKTGPGTGTSTGTGMGTGKAKAKAKAKGKGKAKASTTLTSKQPVYAEHLMLALAWLDSHPSAEVKAFVRKFLEVVPTSGRNNMCGSRVVSAAYSGRMGDLTETRALPHRYAPLRAYAKSGAVSGAFKNGLIAMYEPLLGIEGATETAEKTTIDVLNNIEELHKPENKKMMLLDTMGAMACVANGPFSAFARVVIVPFSPHEFVRVWRVVGAKNDAVGRVAFVQLEHQHFSWMKVKVPRATRAAAAGKNKRPLSPSWADVAVAKSDGEGGSEGSAYNPSSYSPPAPSEAAGGSSGAQAPGEAGGSAIPEINGEGSGSDFGSDSDSGSGDSSGSGPSSGGGGGNGSGDDTPTESDSDDKDDTLTESDSDGEPIATDDSDSDASFIAKSDSDLDAVDTDGSPSAGTGGDESEADFDEDFGTDTSQSRAFDGVDDDEPMCGAFSSESSGADSDYVMSDNSSVVSDDALLLSIDDIEEHMSPVMQCPDGEDDDTAAIAGDSDLDDDAGTGFASIAHSSSPNHAADVDMHVEEDSGSDADDEAEPMEEDDFSGGEEDFPDDSDGSGSDEDGRLNEDIEDFDNFNDDYDDSGSNSGGSAGGSHGGDRGNSGDSGDDSSSSDEGRGSESSIDAPSGDDSSSDGEAADADASATDSDTDDAGTDSVGTGGCGTLDNMDEGNGHGVSETDGPARLTSQATTARSRNKADHFANWLKENPGGDVEAAWRKLSAAAREAIVCVDRKRRQRRSNGAKQKCYRQKQQCRTAHTTMGRGAKFEAAWASSRPTVVERTRSYENYAAYCRVWKRRNPAADAGACTEHWNGLPDEERARISDEGPAPRAPTGGGPQVRTAAEDTSVRTPRSMAEYRPVVDPPEVLHPLHMWRWLNDYSAGFKDGSGQLTAEARDEELAEGAAARAVLDATRKAVATYGRIPRTENAAACVAGLEARLPCALQEAMVLLTVRAYCGTYGTRTESGRVSMRKHLNVLACTCTAAAELWRVRPGDSLPGKYLGTETTWRLGLSPSRLTGLSSNPMHLSCDFCGYQWYAGRSGRSKDYKCKACSRNSQNGAMLEMHSFTPFGVLSEGVRELLVTDKMELHRRPGATPPIVPAQQPPGWAAVVNAKGTYTFTYIECDNDVLLGQRTVGTSFAPNVTPSTTSRLVRNYMFNAENAESSRTVNQQFRMVRLLAGKGQINYCNEFVSPRSFRVNGMYVRQMGGTNHPSPLMHVIAGQMPTTRRPSSGKTSKAKAAKEDIAERQCDRWRNCLILRHRHMQVLRAARDDNVVDFKVVFKFDPKFDGVRAIQFERSGENLRVGRRICTMRHDSDAVDISPMNVHYVPLAYPLIFQSTESVYDTNGTTRKPSCEPTGKITRHQYLKHILLRPELLPTGRLMRVPVDARSVTKPVQLSTPTNRIDVAGKVADEYITDMYLDLLDDRLSIFAFKPGNFRKTGGQGAPQPIGDTAAQGTFITEGLHGSERHLMENVRDCMAVVGARGRPHFFITFTVNMKWPEIVSQLRVGQSAYDRAALITEVFQMKLQAFMAGLQNGSAWGHRHADGKPKYTCTPAKGSGYLMCSIEYQQRGNPHAHIVIRLDQELPFPKGHAVEGTDASFADAFVSAAAVPTVERLVEQGLVYFDNEGTAQLDPRIDHDFPSIGTVDNLVELLGKKVKSSMVHQHPQGESVPAPWCEDHRRPGCCKSWFPARERVATVWNNRGTVDYRREHADRMIVAHNYWFMLYADSHINVEVSGGRMSIAYLYKYIFKGNQGESFAIVDASTPRDEVTEYRKGVSICAMNALFRLQGFTEYYCKPAVLHIGVHYQNATTDTDNGTSKQVLYCKRPAQYAALLILEFFRTVNTSLKPPKQITFEEVTIHSKKRPATWYYYKRAYPCVTRLKNAPVKFRQDQYYLRMLLLQEPVTDSVENYKLPRFAVDKDNPKFETFEQVACDRGYVSNESKAMVAWQEAAGDTENELIPSTSTQLRSLFLTLALGGHAMLNDILIATNHGGDQINQLKLVADWQRLHPEKPHAELMNKFLVELQGRMEANGADIAEILPPSAVVGLTNKVDIVDHEQFKYPPLLQREKYAGYDLNDEQRQVVAWFESAETHAFVGGEAGTGKTYMVNALVAYVRGKGEIAVVTAATALAAQLYEDGQTLHFAAGLTIPNKRDSVLMSEAKPKPLAKQRLDAASLLVVDEISSVSAYYMQAVIDYLAESNPSIKVLVLGDMRQIPPIGRGNGGRADTVALSWACAPSSAEWWMVELTTQQRQRDDPAYAAMCREIGNGGGEVVAETTVDEAKGSKSVRLREINKNNIFRLKDYQTESRSTEAALEAMRLAAAATAFDGVFSEDGMGAVGNVGIMCVTNKARREWNDVISRHRVGKSTTYTATQTIVGDNGDVLDKDKRKNPHIQEALDDHASTYDQTGMPPAKLVLKVGDLVSCVGNVAKAIGMANNRRYWVTALGKNVITVTPADNPGATPILVNRRTYPFELSHTEYRRQQFPLELAWASTINKNQGQSLDVCIFDLSTCPFAHGHAYTGLTRCKHRDTMYFVVPPTQEDKESIFITSVTYPELLEETQRRFTLNTRTPRGKRRSPQEDNGHYIRPVSAHYGRFDGVLAQGPADHRPLRQCHTLLPLNDTEGDAGSSPGSGAASRKRPASPSPAPPASPAGPALGNFGKRKRTAADGAAPAQRPRQKFLVCEREGCDQWYLPSAGLRRGWCEECTEFL